MRKHGWGNLPVIVWQQNWAAGMPNTNTGESCRPTFSECWKTMTQRAGCQYSEAFCHRIRNEYNFDIVAATERATPHRSNPPQRRANSLAKKATRQRKSAPPDSDAEAMTKLPRKTLQDKHLIEVLVRNQGPISRVEIFQQTKMRRSTISLLTRQLLSEGKLVEVGFSNNPLGRKQILLNHNPKFGFVVGIEFDDKSLTAGVMDLETEILHSFKEPTNVAHGQEGLLKQLQNAVHRVVK